VTFGLGFCLVLYGVGFGVVRIPAHFYFRVRFGSWQNVGLIRFVLAGFGFFPITSNSAERCDVISGGRWRGRILKQRI